MSRRNRKKNGSANVTETMELTRVAPGVWSIDGGSEVKAFVRHPVVQVVGGNHGRESTVHVDEGGDQSSYKIWYWGNDNLLPNQREQVVMDNNLVHELTATKMAVVEGSSRFFYREFYENGEKQTEELAPPQWWIDLEESTKKMVRRDFDDLFEIALKNLFLHANAPIEFIRNRQGRLTSIEAWECRHWRVGKQDPDGYVNDHFWCGDWARRGNKTDFPVKRTPAYNYDEDNQQPKFVCHILDNLLHDDYYGIPGWWGSRLWVATANKIPVFHESNIDNGYFIKLHVEMPKDYFTDTALRATAKSEKEFKEYENRESQARQKFMQKVNNLFTGADGNKVLFTEYEINKQIGKDYPGIKVHVLDANKLDESMLKLFDSANEAVISAQGVHPALASIQTQGKLSSGSELRNALNVYTAIKAPRFRRMLNKIYDIARKINAPEDQQNIKMGFKDIIITNLDENSVGMETVRNE